MKKCESCVRKYHEKSNEDGICYQCKHNYDTRTRDHYEVMPEHETIEKLEKILDNISPKWRDIQDKLCKGDK